MFIARCQARSNNKEGASSTFDQAVAAAEAIEKGDPSIRPQTLMHIAKTQAEGGFITDAIMTANSIEIKERNCKEWALAHVASEQARLKDVKGAIALAKSIPRGGDSLALMFIAERQVEARSIEDALKTVEDISDRSYKVEALTIIARAQAKAGDRTSAEKCLEKALKAAEGLEDGNKNLNTSQRAHALTIIAGAQADSNRSRGR